LKRSNGEWLSECASQEVNDDDDDEEEDEDEDEVQEEDKVKRKESLQLM
jgi:hypothetical protein